MNITWFDRLRDAYYTARVNRYARVMEAPLTRAEHDRQRKLVEAAERLSADRTERHATYARRAPLVRHIGGGWKTGSVTPPRTEPRP